MTSITELRELGAPDLEQRERELAEQVFRLRLQKSMGQQEAANRLRRTRRELARVKTLLRGYVLGTEVPASDTKDTKEAADGN
jgi:large subunit ribosomal protein L29